MNFSQDLLILRRFPYHAASQITLFLDSMITHLFDQQENVMSQQSRVCQNGVLKIEIPRDKENKQSARSIPITAAKNN